MRTFSEGFRSYTTKIALEKARERVKRIAKIDDFEKTSTGRPVEGYRHIFVTHCKLCLRVADQKDRMQQLSSTSLCF